MTSPPAGSLLTPFSASAWVIASWTIVWIAALLAETEPGVGVGPVLIKEKVRALIGPLSTLVFVVEQLASRRQQRAQ